jgi:hypothetical protein
MNVYKKLVIRYKNDMLDINNADMEYYDKNKAYMALSEHIISNVIKINNNNKDLKDKTL